MVEISFFHIYGPSFDNPTLYEEVWPKCQYCRRGLRGDCVSVDKVKYHLNCVRRILPPGVIPSEYQ
ncbi:MAG TPA: hypothetical protein VGG32_05950 [Thermoplasmata archaeon]|jgi:hypothetical protein